MGGDSRDRRTPSPGAVRGPESVPAPPPSSQNDPHAVPEVRAPGPASRPPNALQPPPAQLAGLTEGGSGAAARTLATAATVDPARSRTDRGDRPNPGADPVHAANAAKYAPPWLVSAVFHMLLILVLGLWVISDEVGDRLMLIANVSDDLGDQLDVASTDLSQGDPDQQDDVMLLPNDLPEVDDPLAAPPPLRATPDPLTTASSIDAPAIGLALSGREEGMKQTLLAAYGGTGATERAVLEGLKWLVRQQRNNGSWSLTGPYSQGGYDENIMAATAMALLAFQGAGHSHVDGKDGPFQKVVLRGLNVLLKNQDKEGNCFHHGPAFHRLYTQAQCTIALCELYGMTQDEQLKEPAQRAVDYCLRIQDQAGGWRYYPGSGSDTSVTGWVLMALQSARMAYLAVPDAHFQRVGKYLDSVAISGGSEYLYMPASRGGLAMTAEGLLCRQYLGWRRDDPRLMAGVEILAASPIDWNDRNVYYWYYATQVCHHMEGKTWSQWNAVMRELLPDKQTKEGRERGSWSADGDRWGSQGGGRLFVTCLSIYMLEVYYRHLAIYRPESLRR